MQKCVFLDRDGVINADSPAYIKHWSEFEFLPGSLPALKRLTENGFATVIITNQSIINRKMVPLKTLEEIHRNLRSAVRKSGGAIHGIFFCPHTPEENCSCRKPKPGLIHQARAAFDIHLTSAVMVGDSAKDIECAKNAGCGKSILVRTGNGLKAETQLARLDHSPDYIFNDLDEASQWIVDNPLPSGLPND